MAVRHAVWRDAGAGRLANPATPNAATLLYGFFTSGSTGTPKCALNHHGGIANRFSYMTRRFGAGHRVYQNSAALFDSSIWQMLWPLTNGGTSVLPEQRERWTLEEVVDIIRAHGITMTDFVPTLFKLLVRGLQSGAIAQANLASLRHVLIGGEEIDAASVHAFRRLLPGCAIVNTYGHTEASIGMVFHIATDDDGDAIPLGTPIDNTYVRIVDSDLRPVPDGETGEIVVAGLCVGAGYLGDPERSAGRVRCQSISGSAGTDGLPQRRPGAVPSGRHAGIWRPRRRPGQGTWRAH